MQSRIVSQESDLKSDSFMRRLCNDEMLRGECE